MLSWSQAKLDIVKCDNGYVVEWQDERSVKPEDSDAYLKSRGVKLFTTKKELTAFVSKFFAP
jgi:hypothetical protein